MKLTRLKSGTDIRGTALGEDCDLNDEAVMKIAAGFIAYLRGVTGLEPDKMTVAVGRDSRISGERIARAFMRVLTHYGVRILNCSLASTPAMFMTTVMLSVTASVQITASHHPYDRNGIKFFTSEGAFEGEDTLAVLTFAQDADISSVADEVISEDIDFMNDYCARLREIIINAVSAPDREHPLKGLKIVTDAGNGVGGFFALEVLRPLGADITGSIFLEPDGMFPNHTPNPEDGTAMSFIARAVRESGADMGVIFDTDVDRAACVDKNGEEINRNRLIALAASIALDGDKGATVVTDSVTSDGLHDFIENRLGGVHRRFKRGYKNVINEAKRLEALGISAPLAIETSGHAAMRENYYLDDGAYLMARIISLLAKSGNKNGLGDMISGLAEPLEEREIRIKILKDDFKPYGEEVIESLERYAEGREGWTVAADSCEGVRISFDKSHGDGWLLLRLSVHDPILPLNIESNVKGGAELILAQLGPFMKKFEGLDLSSMGA